MTSGRAVTVSIMTGNGGKLEILQKWAGPKTVGSLNLLTRMMQNSVVHCLLIARTALTKDGTYRMEAFKKSCH